MDNFQVNFNEKSGHTLTGHREGDWIIFTCPKCKGFQKRCNWKTREVITIGKTNGDFHAGSYAPPKVDSKNQSSN